MPRSPFVGLLHLVQGDYRQNRVCVVNTKSPGKLCGDLPAGRFRLLFSVWLSKLSTYMTAPEDLRVDCKLLDEWKIWVLIKPTKNTKEDQWVSRVHSVLVMNLKV